MTVHHYDLTELYNLCLHTCLSEQDTLAAGKKSPMWLLCYLSLWKCHRAPLNVRGLFTGMFSPLPMLIWQFGSKVTFTPSGMKGTSPPSGPDGVAFLWDEGSLKQEIYIMFYISPRHPTSV